MTRKQSGEEALRIFGEKIAMLPPLIMESVVSN